MCCSAAFATKAITSDTAITPLMNESTRVSHNSCTGAGQLLRMCCRKGTGPSLATLTVAVLRRLGLHALPAFAEPGAL